MKNLFLLAFYFLSLFRVSAQCCDTAVPHNPVGTSGGEDPMYCPLNQTSGLGFNWMQTTFTAYLLNNPCTPYVLQSPFHSTGGMLNDNIRAFSIPAEKDYLPEDGWAYVTHDFGSPCQGIDQPYLVLYNRYTSTLRVFIAQTELFDQNNYAFITMEFGGNSGQYSNAMNVYNGSGAMNAANNPSGSGPVAAAYNVFDNSLPYWMHADFVLDYDPCNCDRYSELRISLKLVKKENISINLTGGITGDIKEIKTGKTSILQNILGTTVKIIDKLQSIFSGTEPAEGSFLGSVPYLNKIYKAIKITDFFLGLFKKDSPKNFSVNLGINLQGAGSITWEGTYQTILIPMPGSNLSGVDPNVMAHYNNSFGIFALLETPTVTATILEDNNMSLGMYYENYFDCGYANRSVQLRTPSLIKYHINPASQLSIKELVASYEINVLGPGAGAPVQTIPVPIGCFPSYTSPWVLYYEANCICPPPSPNYICDLFGSSYQVFIKISGVFSTPNGHDVVYSAKYKVNVNEVSAGSSIGGEVIPTGCTTINPPATAQQIAAVCDNFPNFTKAELVDRSNAEQNAADFEVGVENELLSVYPNPLQGDRVLVDLNLKTGGEVRTRLFQLDGKLLYENAQRLEAGSQTMTHQFGVLTPGVYILEVDTGNTSNVRKIVVN